ncbi:hypothetical protein [Arthrobacter antioxidans]|uniref:hypothetical protein n=1 Tax=Arthrobacter antioxidans TaxID=2895818 RepID=UPI001FFF3E11|nr:hypothetical protein [Arthrobacter antioxidans]
MDEILGSTYRVRLRSLQWATDLVRELRHSEDIDAVSVAAHWALDAVYDLFEVYRLATPIGKNHDAWLERNDAKTVGGLIFIRGEKTHQAAQVGGPNPFKKYSDDFADFANLTNWGWAKASTKDPRYERRLQWYSQNVVGRALWVPLDHAWHWFVENSPDKVPGQDARLVPGWVEGVHPIYKQ